MQGEGSQPTDRETSASAVGDGSLRHELTRVSSQRDALLHQLLRTHSSVLGRLGDRWTSFAAEHRRVRSLVSRPTQALWLLLTLRWPRGIRVNPLFEEAWYREQYPDAPRGRKAAYRQYLRMSLTKGRDPNPHFDTDWYLDRNPDVRGGHWHPLDHYLYFGWREGRDPAPDFDGFDYLRHHPDAAAKAENPLLHSMRGRRASRVLPRVPALPGTAPTLRRLSTHYRRHGARRTVARVATELGIPGAMRSRSRSAVAAVVPEIDAGRIRAHLDAPAEDSIEAMGHMLVAGWAYSPGSQVSGTVYIDHRHVADCVTGQPRPDVGMANRKSEEAAVSGFSARVSLRDIEPGKRSLQVVLRDPRGATRVLISSFRRVRPDSLYHHYWERALPTDGEIHHLADSLKRRGTPDVHIVVVARDLDKLGGSLRSIRKQGYPSLSCEIVVDRASVREAETVLASTGLRATVSSILHEALPDDVAPSRMVGFIEAGDRLAPAALWQMVAQDAVADPLVVYSDHDSIDDTGRHVRPWFVPDWSPDRFLSQDYVGGFYLARDGRALRDALPRSVESPPRSWRYGLLLRLSAARGAIAHVPAVLWSRPLGDPSEADAVAELDAVVDILGELGVTADVRTVHVGPDDVVRSVEWPLTAEPLVSVIIPTTGRLEFVAETVASLHRTSYQNIELIFVDNSRGHHPDGIAFLRGEDVTIIERDEPFNWAKLNNDGARLAKGEMLLFLNDDIEVRDPDWLTGLVRHALREEVGAVGSLLTYPDGTVQHLGVFLVGHGGGAIHLFHGMDPDQGLYLDLQHVTREVTSLTGACLMVRRAVFDKVNGFDESLAVTGNDVDLCLRIARTGRRLLVEPRSRLVHRESQSRSGIDYSLDENRIWELWSDLLERGDPHHNPNLAQDRPDASLDWGRVSARKDSARRVSPSDGVNLVGYLRAEMGLGEAVRGDALALTEADVPFVAIDHMFGSPARFGDTSWSHKIVDDPVFHTNIIHVNADVLPRALQHMPEGLRDGRRNIGYWTWELPEFPEAWHGSFSLVEEVWVPSVFVREAVAAVAPVPVHVVPHVVRTPTGPFRERGYFGLPEDASLFLSMYDTQSVMERKNPEGAIDAFTRAFDPDDDGVMLVLKVNSAGAREVSMLRARVAGRPNIRIIVDVFSRAEMDSLIARSDVFVSLHRSEGFGLPMAEAMAMGVPVVATGWSGNMDFTSDGTAACVAYRLVELERTRGPYEAGQRWAEPDIDDAARWLERLRADVDLRAHLGTAGYKAIRERNSAAVVGSIIASRIGSASGA